MLKDRVFNLPEFFRMAAAWGIVWNTLRVHVETPVHAVYIYDFYFIAKCIV